MRHKKFSSLGRKLEPSNLYTTKRKIEGIVVHTTATKPNQDAGALSVDKMHLRKWGAKSGCGYHYIVRRDGTLEKGRWVDFPGAHVYGHNQRTIGVAWEGGLDDNGFISEDSFTALQYSTLVKTLKRLRSNYKLLITQVKGHREYPYVNKACPCLNMSTLRGLL